MLRSVNDLKGFEIVATDGEIGDIEEFYFDDERWAVRYIVVNTGNWLSGRQVLVSPFSVVKVDRENSKLHVDLTKSQVEKSPHIDTHHPVSRQMEAAHSDYYGLSLLLGQSVFMGNRGIPCSGGAAIHLDGCHRDGHGCDCRSGARRLGRRPFA